MCLYKLSAGICSKSGLASNVSKDYRNLPRTWRAHEKTFSLNMSGTYSATQGNVIIGHVDV